MSILNLIHNRYSPRAFSEQMVSTEQLDLLFEAGRWAPSSRNEQPWRFFYATKENIEHFNAYFSILNAWNQKWAQSAPVIIAAVAKLNSDHNNMPNSHALYDVGQAVAYLTLQATDMGLYVHQMGGFYPDKAKEVLNLPDGFAAITMLVVGYKGSPDRIPEEYQKTENKKSERLPLNSLVFCNNQKMR